MLEWAKYVTSPETCELMKALFLQPFGFSAKKKQNVMFAI